MNIEEFLTLAAKEEASDLFIVAGLPLTMKVNGVMRRINEEKNDAARYGKIIREIYEKALDRDIDQLLKTGMMISHLQFLDCQDFVSVHINREDP